MAMDKTMNDLYMRHQSWLWDAGDIQFPLQTSRDVTLMAVLWYLTQVHRMSTIT